MSARDPVSSLAHAHLSALTEFLHKYAPAQALARFSQRLESTPCDVLSENAIHYVLSPVEQRPKEELITRALYAKRQMTTCLKHLAEVAAPKLRHRTVVVHPLGALSARLLRKATVRCISINQTTNAQSHAVHQAPEAFDGSDLLMLEARAVTKDGFIASKGARLLIELARARGIPVYGLATSWHATPSWNDVQAEYVHPNVLTGIISEHGIYAHDQFLARVQKTFPWLL